MCDVLNRHRLSRGWHPLPADDAEVQANVWIDVLDTAGIPARAYTRLYGKATEIRSASIRKGDDPPDFSAELFVSAWEGPNGVRSEIARANAENRQIACTRCGGSGWKPFVPADGRYPGVTRCSHD